MANRVYTKCKQAFLSSSINFSSDTIKAALVSSSYSPNTATDQFWSTVSANAITTPVALTSKSVTDGVFNADPTTFPSVASGTATYVVIYKDTGTSSTSPLILLIDSATNLPITATGGDLVVNWNASGIFDFNG